jgi:hypothetical protein
MHDLAQLGMALAGGAAADGEDRFHSGVEQALAERALPDHPRAPEEDDLHGPH